jgi:cellobiose-specific phosphotransferase system component IIB
MMLTVAIVCGAGASSTFLSRRMSDIADLTQQSLRFVPLPLESVDADAADLVALASHVVSGSVIADLSERGIACVVLPETVRGGFGADVALETISEFLRNSSVPNHASALSESDGNY